MTHPVQMPFRTSPLATSDDEARRELTMAMGQAARIERLTQAAEALNGLGAAELLDKAIHEIFPGRIAVVSSFGAESAVLLDLVARTAPACPVLFLETERHFPETLAYRDLLTERLGLTGLRNLHPAANEAAEEDPDGDLWRRDPDGCCDLRKVRPLDRALSGYDAWISGRKRFHGGERSDLPTAEVERAPGGEVRLKLNPLAGWREEQIDEYFDNFGLPRHPLWQLGYPSIGCATCTAKPDAATADRRAGRWAGQGKTECGIHRSPAFAVR